MKLNLDFSDFSSSAPQPAQAPGGGRAPANVDDFVRQYEPQARRVAERLKVPVDAVLGQWGLETGWGKGIIPGTNNLGNIMDFSGGGVAAVDNKLGRTDKYRAYGSVDEFADDFGNLIESGNRGRYRAAVGAKDAQSYFQVLKQGGYAEGENYVNAGVGASRLAADALGRIKPAAAQAADFTGVPAWESITAKAEYKALTPEKQAEAKAAYFDYYIAPRAGKDAASIRQMFLSQQAPAAEKPRATEGLGSSDPVFDAPQPYEPSTGSVMDAVRGQRTDVPQGVTQSLAPLAPEARRAIENSYNAMTPEQRIELGRRTDAIGQYATELNQRYGLIDKNPVKTAERIDPRAEKRAVRMAGEGLDGEAAENMARTAARFGVMPGQEIVGTIGETKFDFDSAEAFKNDPILSNPLVRGLTKGGVMYLKGAAGMGEAMADLVLGPENTGKRSTEWLRGKENAIGEAGTMLQRNFEGALSSIVSQLPTMVGGAAVASKAVSLAGMAMNSFGNEYTDGKAKGLDPGAAATRAGLFAAFEVIGESFGLGGVLAAMRKAGQGIADPGELAKFFASNLKKEIPGELLTTTGQFGVDKLPGIGLNQQAGLEDYLKQAADTIVQTVMQGGIMVGGTTGVSKAVQFLREGDTTSAEAQFSRELNRQIEGGQFTTTAEQAGAEVFSRGPQAGLEMRLPGVPNAPTPAIPGASIQYADNAQVTPDGRIEPTVNLGNLPQDNGSRTEPTVNLGGAAKPVDPLVQSADEIVRGLAAEAGLPESTVLPGAATSQTSAPADQEILDFAEARFQQLRQKRDGTDEDLGVALTPSEEQEFQTLVQARGNPAALRAFYTPDQQGVSNVRQTQESLDGSSTRQASGQADAQAQNATGSISEQPGQQPNENGQAQGLNQAIDGLGQLFGGQPQETEDEREARLEREAIQSESQFAGSSTNDDNIPFDEPPPLTEDEARKRREQQASGTQTNQAQQSQSQTPQGTAPAAPAPRAKRELKPRETAALFEPFDRFTVETEQGGREVELSWATRPETYREVYKTDGAILNVGGITGIPYKGPTDPASLRKFATQVVRQRAAQDAAANVKPAGKPKTEKQAKQEREAKFQDALDQEYNNGFESNSPASNPVLRSKQDLEADYGPLTDPQVDQLRAAYSQGQTEADAAEKAGGSQPKQEAPKTDQAKDQRDVEAFTAQIQSATSVEEISRITSEASGRFPNTDELGEREPNGDDRAMAAITQAAVQRAKQITEGGEVDAPKPKTEKEARQQRLAKKPLPEWTQKTQGFPANTTFAWQQDGDNVVLVAKVGDKEFGRVAENQVKDGTSIGTMRLTKALLDESLRQAGQNPDATWKPASGDTSVEDAKKRREQKTDNRGMAKRQLEAAIERADAAGAMKVKGKLIDLQMAFDRKDKGPKQVMDALAEIDAAIEKETAGKRPISEEEKFVVMISEITFDKGTVQDFLDKHGKAAFKRALELGYIDNKLEFPTSRLFATNRVVYELQQKYYNFNGGIGRPVRKKPEKAKPAEAAAPPAPAPTPAPTSIPDLDGVKVTFDVLVEDTGQTAQLTVDAKQHMQELDDREAVLRELVDCLSK